MYNNLKDWINVPVTLKPFLKRDGAGDIIHSADVSLLCYPVGEVKIIHNAAGAEVVSTTHLYVDGSTQIDTKDSIVFEGKECPIQTITSFYRNGVADIKVVYL